MNICASPTMVSVQKTNRLMPILNWKLMKSLPKIEVVPQDIGRVLLNLINNAFYAVDKRAKEHPLPSKGGSEESTRNINQQSL